MALIVLVHGAFNELWGPRELHARWVPALRDGLWSAGTDIEPDDVAVSFYGDLFRHDPESEEAPDEVTRAGVADMLHETLGDDMLATLSQAAGKATFERTVDLVGTLMTKPDLQLERPAPGGRDGAARHPHHRRPLPGHLRHLQRARWPTRSGRSTPS